MRIPDPTQVRERMRSLVGHEVEDELARMVASTGALLRGHFRLQSGLHASYFLRFGQLAFQTEVADRIAAITTAAFALSPRGKTVVLCAESAGRYLGAALARALRVDLAIAAIDEHRRPTGALRRGTLDGADDVIVATDVVTTGQSLLSLIELAATASSIRVVAFARLDAHPIPPALIPSGVTTHCLMQARWTRYHAGDCALCRDRIPLLPAIELN